MPVSKIQTGLRLDEITYNKLKTLATSENRSINNIAEYILKKYIAEYEEANGPIRYEE